MNISSCKCTPGGFLAQALTLLQQPFCLPCLRARGWLLLSYTIASVVCLTLALRHCTRSICICTRNHHSTFVNIRTPRSKRVVSLMIAGEGHFEVDMFPRRA